MLDVAEYIGVPFKELGRDLSGWDCWGCHRHVMEKKAGIVLPSFADQYESPLDYEKCAQIIQQEISPWDEIAIGAEKEFDSILLRIRGFALHIGTVVEKNWMLHVERDTATILERYDSNKWNKKIIGFYRHIELCQKKMTV